jgi:iron complex outermembrane receptor protein
MTILKGRRVRLYWMYASVLSAGLIATEAAAQTGATLEEIVVTAQKRSQNLQDVPIAVTAVTQEALQANRVNSVGDLNALAPNLVVRQSPGAIGIPLFTMRGVFSTGSVPGSDKQVSMYVDGVYIGMTQSSLFDFADIERIEVLRGPQGTLFGRNATAGAISIITPDPKGEFGVRQELSYGNYDQFRSKTRIDLPTWKGLSAAVTYVHDQRNGDIKNLGAGRTWDRTGLINGRPAIQTSPKTLGAKNSEALLFALKLEPSSNLTLSYKFDYVVSDYSQEGVAPVAVAPNFAGIIAAQTTPVVFDTSVKRPKAVNNSWATPAYSKNFGHNFTATLNLSDKLTVKNILSYRSSYAYGTHQYDGLGGLINTGAPIFSAFLGPARAAATVGAPFVLLVLTNDTVNKQWSNETQVNYDSKRLTVTAGAVYFKLSTRAGPPIGFNNSDSFTVIPGGRITPNLITSGLSYNWATSRAAYVQAEAHITAQIDLVGGYRITKDHKTGIYYNPNPFGFSYEKTKPAYMASLNYKPTSDILIYGKYSSSFLSGGSVGAVPFAPETARSWEAGLKADLLGRRLRTNLALFDVKYDHIQGANSGRNVGHPEVITVVIDSGSAKAKGFEAEATAVPVHGLTLGAALSYTDFKYTSIAPLLGTLSTYLPTNRPKWTSNLSAQYETVPLFGNLRLRLRADANYKSKSRAIPTLADSAGAFGLVAFVPSTWTVNGRASIGQIKVGRGEGEIALWVKNLTNAKDILFPNVINGLFASTNFVAARTFGVDVSVQY